LELYIFKQVGDVLEWQLILNFLDDNRKLENETFGINREKLEVTIRANDKKEAVFRLIAVVKFGKQFEQLVDLEKEEVVNLYPQFHVLTVPQPVTDQATARFIENIRKLDEANINDEQKVKLGTDMMITLASEIQKLEK